MNTLIVYYSRTGHNEQMAKRLQEETSADIDQIIDSKNRDGMLGCVVVTPLWGGVLPPATRTYLAQNGDKFTRFAFISICGRGEENRNALADVRSMAHKEPFATLLVKEEEFANQEYEGKLKTFAHMLPH